MTNNVKYVGLDVHKKSITVAIADEGRDGQVRMYGRIPNSIEAVDKLCRKLVSTRAQLNFVYEAGPCGYVTYRHLTAKGLDCMVAAPSMIPRKSGDRIKNDRRDARNLARLYRAGELTGVYVPDLDQEAMRDLTRAREDAQKAARKCKQQLGAFLLRHGHIYPGKSHWSKAHWNWLANIAMDHPVQQIVLQEYIDAVRHSQQRVDRASDQIRQTVPRWSLAPLVDALQAARGVSLITATTIVAELGDLSRFESAPQFMAYLGLVPSEYSSGDNIKRAGITKTGNAHVRKVLVEAAWAYRLPARCSRVLLKRLEKVPESVRKIAWKAQIRLCARYRRLTARGKRRQVTIAAIARELAGFLWAIAQQVSTEH